MNIDPIQAKVDGFILDNSTLLREVNSKILREAMYKLLKEVVESFKQPAKLTQKEFDTLVEGPSYWKSALYRPAELHNRGTICGTPYDPNQLVYAGQPNSSRSEDFGEVSKVYTGRPKLDVVTPTAPYQSDASDHWATLSADNTVTCRLPSYLYEMEVKVEETT